MARSEARISVDVWTPESDFIDLTADEQWMYFFLLSQRDLNHLGVLALRERRWSRAATDLTPRDIEVRLAGLERSRYIVVDHATEEILVRSLMRRDEVYRQPNLMKSAARALPLVESRLLRAAIGVELRRILDLEMVEHSVEIIGAMLEELGPPPGPEDYTRSSMHRDDDTRSSMPSGGDDTRPSMPAGEEGSANPSPNPSSKVARSTLGEGGTLRPLPTSAPSPLPLSPVPLQTPPGSDARVKRGDSRGTRLPDDFAVTEPMKEWARENAPLAGLVDHDSFCDHWRAQAGQRAVKRDWEATWRNWMRRTQENRSRGVAGGSRPRPVTTSTTDDRVSGALQIGAQLQAIHDEAQRKAVGQ